MAIDVGPPSGGPTSSVGLDRERPGRTLLALRRGGWVSAEQVAQTQREFLLEAVAEAVGELGYAAVPVREVIARAGVSRRTLYDHFEGLDDCLLAALDAAHVQVWQAALDGHDSRHGGSWSDRVQGSVVEVLALLDARSTLARLCVVGAPTGPLAARAAHQRFVDGLAHGLTACARQGAAAHAVPDRVARGLVAGAVMMVHERLTDPAGHDGPLIGLANEIASLLCGPFDAAQSIRARPVPAAEPVQDWSAPAPAAGPVVRWQAEKSGGGMRKEILRFLLDCPGACNTQIAEHLESNQSTVSRRLASMAQDDLVCTSRSAGRHAWHVTDRGRQAV